MTSIILQNLIFSYISISKTSFPLLSCSLLKLYLSFNLLKENKVNNIACLNDDCVSIYNDIDVKGKSIGDSIDNLYNLAKEKV